MLSSEWSRRLRGVVIPAVAVVVAACGGGGGGGGGGDPASSGGSGGHAGGAGVGGEVEVGAPGSAQLESVADWTSPHADGAQVFPVVAEGAYLKAAGWSAAVNTPAESTYTPQFTGKGWYVDAQNGADTNPGTQAQPWRSLQRAAQAKLAAGDALLFRCGQTWRGDLAFTHQFAPAGQVLVGAYGDCAQGRRPVIRGSDWIDPAGWAKTGSGVAAVYSRAYDKPVKRLFLSGAPMVQARFPNHRGVGAEFAQLRALDERDRFQVAAADLPALAARDLVGANIYVRVKAWQVDQAVVKAFNASTGLVTLDRDLTQPIAADAGYILEGKRWMLDGPDEWWFDAAAKRLYLWGGDTNWPAKLGGLEASWRNRGLDVRWVQGLRVERLRFEQQEEVGLHLTEAGQAKVTDVQSFHAGEMGLSLLASDDALVQNTVVLGAGKVGINLRAGVGGRVLNSTVSDTGLYRRAAISDSGISVLEQNNATVAGNLVQRSAKVGIRFGNRPGVVVRDNTVLMPCVRLTDCGGIYTFTASAPTAPEATYVARGTVERNVIVGARSNLDGVGSRARNMAVGIFLDELSSGVKVSANTISSSEVGISIHNGSFNQIIDNTVRGSIAAGFRGTVTRTDMSVMRSNRIVGNSFETHVERGMEANGVPKELDMAVSQFWHHPVDVRSILTGAQANEIAGNINWSMQGDEDVRWKFSGGGPTQIIDTQAWKAYAPTDINANPVRIKPYVLNTSPTSLVSNGAFTLGLGQWRTYFSKAGTGGFFDAVSSSPLCGGAPHCARFKPGATGDYLVSAPFDLDPTPGQNLYVLRYGVVGGVGGGNLSARIRRDVSPYESYGMNVFSEVVPQGESRKVEKIFRASGGSGAVLHFSGHLSGETLLNQVSLHRVLSVDFPQKSRLSAHAVNTQGNAMAFSCSTLGLAHCDAVDDNGQPVVWPLIVQPRASTTVYARDPKWLGS